MASSLRVLLYSLSVLIGLTSAACPPNFQLVARPGGVRACYYLNQNPWTWNDAWKDCADNGGYLAEFSEHLKMENFLRFLETIESYQYYWIGGSDGVVHGDWRWIKYSEQVSLEIHWCPGRPSQKGYHHGLLLDALIQFCMTDADPMLTTINNTNIGYICEADFI